MNLVSSKLARPRIAWCSTTPFPEVYRHLGQPVVHHCPWKSMLLDQARRSLAADWMVVSQGPSELSCDFTEGATRYVVLGQGKRLHHWTYDWRGFDAARKVLGDWEPDLLHVHGSENYFGLLHARSMLNVPTLIALQGLLGPYLPHVWGGLPAGKVIGIEPWRDLARGSGMLGQARQWQLGARLETEILTGNRWFAGRTTWDQAHLLASNPEAFYRVIGEVLRPEFSGPAWSISSSDRYRLYFTNLSGPIKGGETLVEALRLVKRSIPSVKLVVSGSMNPAGGYGRYLMGKIEAAGLLGNITFLGYLDGEGIAGQLRRARAFVSASFIDNSPNSVGEALCLGTPSVCSYVGGIPTLGNDGQELAFFPAGDSASLARTLIRVMQDDEFAQKLSINGRRKALDFHSPVKITSQLLSIYHEMLGPAATGTLRDDSVPQKISPALPVANREPVAQ